MTIIIWKCTKCNSIQISNSRIHHQMDFCKCGECGLDLEEYSCRFSGNNPLQIIELKRIEPNTMDIWTELQLDMIEQNLTIDLSPLFGKYCIDLSQHIKLNDIEKEVLLDLLK
ncbi:MAG: hypothetical protein WC346_04590 [Methanogenium sp.]